MELKDKLVSAFMALENQVDLDHPVHDIRSAAIKVFENQGFPTKKEEAWKYTSLKAIEKIDFSIFPRESAPLEYKEVKQYFLQEMDTYKIVFVDGIFSSYLSETTHQGIDVCLMSAALTKDMYKPVIEAYFNKIASVDENLTALNTAFSKEGAFIHIPKNTQAMKPIEIIHFATGAYADIMLQPRNLVVVEENSEV
jgi:Fe-S cluster assembly protein SufD